ncbi:MAG: cyclase family protein, partial [Lachnospiraceae bacterium]|nr:cyclase family protein [Lachnospiraceae bacterium]
MNVIDLTHTIKEKMPVFPGTNPPKLIPTSSYENDGFKETLLQIYTHTGTHMDPPAHIFADKMTLDQFPVSQFIGKALVIDCRNLKEGEEISMSCIRKYGKKAEQADFLLFHLGWDKRWGTDDYFGDYPCLDETVLDYIISGNYKGIGFDVIGLDPVNDVNLIRHKKLFANTQIVN